MDTLRPGVLANIFVKVGEPLPNKYPIDSFLSKLNIGMGYDTLKSLCADMELKILTRHEFDLSDPAEPKIINYIILIETSFGFELVGSGPVIDEAVNSAVVNLKDTDLIYNFFQLMAELDVAGLLLR